MVDGHAALDPQQGSDTPSSATIRHCVTARSKNHGKTTAFILSGFHQEDDIRYYIFVRPNDRGTSTEFTVDADVGLLRKYGIGLQELPLLCRHLLEKQNAGSQAAEVTFSEDLMKEQADHRAALKQAAQAKKAYRRRRATRLGQNFR